MSFLRDRFFIIAGVVAFVCVFITVRIHVDANLYKQKAMVKEQQLVELKQLIEKYRSKSSLAVLKRTEDIFTLLTKAVSTMGLSKYLEDITPVEGGYLLHFKKVNYRMIVGFLSYILKKYRYVHVRSAAFRSRGLKRWLDVTLVVAGGD